MSQTISTGYPECTKLLQLNRTISTGHPEYSKLQLPKRVLLIRHGESEGNVNEEAYHRIPDWKIRLTTKGEEEAKAMGKQIKSMIGDEPIYVYYSPYLRTRQTMQHLLAALPDNPIYGIREEPRITEQQFGNFQNQDMGNYKKQKQRFGYFYYRFPEGESGLDVYNRVTSFIGSLFREWYSHSNDPNFANCNVIMVLHGLSLRLFVMRWFQFTVHQFEASRNPKNCAVVMMERSRKIPRQGCNQDEECLKITPESQEMLNFHVPKKTEEQYRSPYLTREDFERMYHFEEDIQKDVASICDKCEECKNQWGLSMILVVLVTMIALFPGILLP